ncbi:MAG: ribosome maturation factor RimP [Firmicutes bacterium]|nr:ribosome maturation factor RimP [Bacillota bacterium]
MQAKEIVALTEKLSMPILQQNGLEFVDCEFVKEGAGLFLRLYIDKEGGVSIDECELVSRALDEKLPEDITDKPYILEVSSPGIDRILKRDHEYIKYKGRDVEVKLFKPVDGVKQFEGALVALADGKVVINTVDGEMSFDKKDVASTRLAVRF